MSGDPRPSEVTQQAAEHVGNFIHSSLFFIWGAPRDVSNAVAQKVNLGRLCNRPAVTRQVTASRDLFQGVGQSWPSDMPEWPT